MENRNGLCVDVSVGAADGHAEREHALKMLRRLRRRGFQPRTLGADKGYDFSASAYNLVRMTRLLAPS